MMYTTDTLTILPGYIALYIYVLLPGMSRTKSLFSFSCYFVTIITLQTLPHDTQ